MSWKIGEEKVEEVGKFKCLGVWVDGKLRDNVDGKKAEEWIGKVTWMSKVNGWWK